MITPQNNYVIFEPVQVRKKLEGGLVLPDDCTDTENTNVQFGNVIASAIKEIKKDDLILCNKFTPTQFKYHEIMYNAVKYTDIIAIIKEKSKDEPNS